MTINAAEGKYSVQTLLVTQHRVDRGWPQRWRLVQDLTKSSQLMLSDLYDQLSPCPETITPESVHGQFTLSKRAQAAPAAPNVSLPCRPHGFSTQHMCSDRAWISTPGWDQLLTFTRLKNPRQVVETHLETLQPPIFSSFFHVGVCTELTFSDNTH